MPLSRDAILTVLSGLTVLGCNKAATPPPEPTASAAPAAATAPSADAPAPAALTATPSADAPAPAVSAREVAPAAGSAEKEKTCSPGGCAPGMCGANKK